MKVREKLFVLFGEYVSNVPTPSTSSEMAGQATQETEEQYANEANEGSLPMMQVFYFFIIIFNLYYDIYILLRLTFIILFLYVGI